MEDINLPSSPRKKLKMDTDSTPNAVLGDITLQQNSSSQEPPDLQLSKEAQVGITEFVSSDLPGFNGLLKKR